MKQTRKHWLLALAGGVSVAGAAFGLAERPAAEPPKVDRQQAQQGLHSARELSEAFRAVARQAMPSVVSIEVTGKPLEMTGLQGRNPLGDLENSPFRDFFENDPQLRRFFGDGEGLQQLPRGRMPRQHGRGSGFIIDASGVIMTNNHVVENAEKVVVRLQDGTELTATKWKTDPASDVAVVWVDPKGEELQPIALGDSARMEIGDWVLAVGSPFGLDMTVTQGIISAKGRAVGITDRGEFLQTDAAINPGNSGGPLLNLDGEVIGINTAISTESGGYDGIGFAIPINNAKWIADQLVEKGQVQRAYLGVGIQEIDSRLADKLGTDVGTGVVVTQVMPNTPAATAGLQPGDVIVAVEGKTVRSPRNLQGLVEQLQCGPKYEMTVVRDGKKKQLQFTVCPLPEDLETAATGEGDQSEDADEQKFDELGLQVQDVTPALAKQLKLEDAKGVIVTAVEPDSPAANAGLQTGDLIENAGSKKIASVEEFQAAVKDADLDEGVLLYVRGAGGVARFVVVEK